MLLGDGADDGVAGAGQKEEGAPPHRLERAHSSSRSMRTLLQDVTQALHHIPDYLHHMPKVPPTEPATATNTIRQAGRHAGMISSSSST